MVLLEVKNLGTHYFTRSQIVRAVDGVSFELGTERVIGIAGESGCGKTTAGLSLIKLLPKAGRIVKGSILFNGEDLVQKTELEMRAIRGKEISITFQGAMNALNPVKKVGKQVLESVLTHENINRSEALSRVKEYFDLVGIGRSRVDDYPHELSGGMKQRVLIAMGLICGPKIFIADEITTALDVMVQAQIMDLILALKRRMHLSMIIISHDLSIIAEICDDILIMYAGKIMEYADAMSIFRKPVHPYTKKLIGAFPSITGQKKPLDFVPGTPPSLSDPPPGCRFHPRCPFVESICRKEEPEIAEIGKRHFVACHSSN
jgi:peptide/nickel transport system ATP-binding protein